MAHQRAFCVPALVSSFIACILLLLCTISTPTTFHTSTPFNFVQASNLGNITDGTNNTANHERLIIGLKVNSEMKSRRAIWYVLFIYSLSLYLYWTAWLLGILQQRRCEWILQLLLQQSPWLQYHAGTFQHDSRLTSCLWYNTNQVWMDARVRLEVWKQR